NEEIWNTNKFLDVAQFPVGPSPDKRVWERLMDLPLSEDTIQKIMSAMFVDYFFAGCCCYVTMLFNDSLGRLTKQRKTTRDKWVESHDSKSLHVLLDSW
ncbi:hypothetical protein Tco_1333454, partial [Tanacetum coccineum]